MARARRQPDARSGMFSNARIDALGRGGRMPFIARLATRSRHDAFLIVEAQVEFKRALR
jgi:hypothetical protein